MTQKVILADTGTAKAETVRMLNLIREEPLTKRESGTLLSLFYSSLTPCPTLLF
jgi:hypothetical protein